MIDFEKMQHSIQFTYPFQSSVTFIYPSPTENVRKQEVLIGSNWVSLVFFVCVTLNTYLLARDGHCVKSCTICPEGTDKIAKHSALISCYDHIVRGLT